jgi:hypothetical protein
MSLKGIHISIWHMVDKKKILKKKKKKHHPMVHSLQGFNSQQMPPLFHVET